MQTTFKLYKIKIKRFVLNSINTKIKKNSWSKIALQRQKNWRGSSYWYVVKTQSKLSNTTSHVTFDRIESCARISTEEHIFSPRNIFVRLASIRGGNCETALVASSATCSFNELLLLLLLSLSASLSSSAPRFHIALKPTTCIVPLFTAYPSLDIHRMAQHISRAVYGGLWKRAFRSATVLAQWEQWQN